MCWMDCGRTLWKLSTGREPLRWLPLSFSSAIVCTAVAQARSAKLGPSFLNTTRHSRLLI